MVEVEIYARYVRQGLNSFAQRINEGDFGRIPAEVEDSSLIPSLEQFSRRSIPKGYEFIELTLQKDGFSLTGEETIAEALAARE
jgi:hypothetical protein